MAEATDGLAPDLVGGEASWALGELQREVTFMAGSCELEKRE